MWDFPQAFLNGCGHGASGARNTCALPPRLWSTAISSHLFSGTDLAPDPWLLFPNTLFAIKMADNKSNVVEEDDGGNMEESENEEGFS